MKILVVDDNSAIRDSIVEIFSLEDDSYEMIVADNGAAALEKFSSNKPDVVLLDIAMPVMDGIDTLVRILKQDRYANVIMISAQGSHTNVEKCLELGATTFIEKPFTNDEILAAVKNALTDDPKKRAALTAFSRASTKMTNSITKLTERIITVSLQDLEIHSSNQNFSQVDVQNIGTGFNIKVDKCTLEVLDGYLGFANEDSEKKNSKIISIINKNNLYKIFLGKDAEKLTINNEDIVFQELFNIIHNNITTELVDTLHIDFNLLPTRKFDANIDSQSPGLSFITVRFEINSDGEKYTLETYVWF